MDTSSVIIVKSDMEIVNNKSTFCVSVSAAGIVPKSEKTNSAASALPMKESEPQRNGNGWKAMVLSSWRTSFRESVVIFCAMP